MPAINPWAGVLEHWKLDETTGTRKATYTGVDLDDSWGTYTGASSAAGKFGNAFHCYGVDTGIGRYDVSTYAGVTAVAHGTGDFSVSLWVKLNPALLGTNTLLARWDSDEGFYDYSIVVTGYMGGTADIQFSMSDGYGTTPLTVTLDSNWHHIAATCDDAGGGIFEFWWDGVRSTSDHIGTVFPACVSDGFLYIGQHPGGVGALQDFKNDVDAVTLWRRKLSDAEIALIATGLPFGETVSDGAEFDAGRLVCEVRDPAGKVRGILNATDTAVHIEAEQGNFSWYAASVTLPPDSPLLTETYGGYTILQEHAGWSLWVIYWGYDWRDSTQLGESREDCFAKCEVMGWTLEQATEGGSTAADIGYTVKLTGLGLTDRILGARMAMNATWARYKIAGGATSWSNVLAEMLEKQTDNTQRPSGYNSAGGDRTNYGAWSRSGTGASVVAAVAATTTKYRIDSGSALHDALRDISKQQSIGWSFRVSPSARTWKLYTYGDLGNDRTTGSSGQVTFSRSLNNLVTIRIEKDDSGTSSMYLVSGRGYRANQKIGWTKDSAAYARYGSVETGERHDTAWATDISYETGALRAVFAHGFENWTVTLREDAFTRFGWEYGVGTVVRVIVEELGQVFTKRIVKAKISSGSPAMLQVELGDITSYMDDEGGGGRSGGGVAGSRRMGGPPKAKAGEPQVFFKRNYADSTSVTADNANDELYVLPHPDVPCNPWAATGYDAGEGDGEDADTREEERHSVCLYEVAGALPTTNASFTLTGTFSVTCTGSTYTVHASGLLSDGDCDHPSGTKSVCLEVYWPCCPSACGQQVVISLSGTVPVPAFNKLLAVCTRQNDGTYLRTRTIPSYDQTPTCSGVFSISSDEVSAALAPYMPPEMTLMGGTLTVNAPGGLVVMDVEPTAAQAATAAADAAARKIVTGKCGGCEKKAKAAARKRGYQDAD